MVEGQTLALVDGDGPRQTERILNETANDLTLNLFALFVELVFRVLPCLTLHLYGFFVAGTKDENHILVDISYAADATVVVASFRVVLQEHHLCACSQRQPVVGGIVILGEVFLYLGIEGVHLRRKCLKLTAVIVVGLAVVGRQSDIAVVGVGTERRIVAGVKRVEVVGGDMPVAYIVENLQEVLVLLTVYVFQLYGDVVDILQGVRPKEVRRVVVLL